MHAKSQSHRKLGDMVGYTARAAKALGYLKRRYNDIEIFVEDTSNHNMWLRIIQKIIPPTVRVTSVNMLGGRKSVLDACRLDQKDDGRKKIYIIDGDFDFLLGRPKARLKHLYRIRAYCIENILLHPESVFEVGVDSRPMSTKQDIANLVDYPSLIGVHEAKLRSLFIVYATAYQVASNVKTTSYPVMKLTTAIVGSASLNAQKLGRRIMQVVREACQLASVQTFSSVRRKIQQRAAALHLDQIVSGKDYLLPLVWVRLRRKCGYKGSKEQLNIHLAKEFRPEFEPWLARRIRSVAQ